MYALNLVRAYLHVNSNRSSSISGLGVRSAHNHMLVVPHAVSRMLLLVEGGGTLHVLWSVSTQTLVGTEVEAIVGFALTWKQVPTTTFSLHWAVLNGESVL